jgi:hypothetical protein
MEKGRMILWDGIGMGARKWPEYCTTDRFDYIIVASRACILTSAIDCNLKK